MQSVSKRGVEHRSGCPISLSLEVLGDRWSLLILRDMMFGDKRHFRELMRSEERIASNILTDRLTKLVEEGLITKSGDPSHKQRVIFSLTDKAIDLVPVFATLGAWGRRHLPVSEALSARARVLEEGGPEMWTRFKAELRQGHLGQPETADPATQHASVTSILKVAHEDARAREEETRSRSARS